MILLQILDDGSVTDRQGRKVDFKNDIILAHQQSRLYIVLYVIPQYDTGLRHPVHGLR
ncbi:hypothetical protein B0H13DRAFT_2272110 [Mycena leptocephala]|nr:hypothetical protein B0H13DRAFT_2272110 [Mycena leptocephala]